MTAVVGPVGIQHTDLCHGRISFLFVLKIILNMKKILKGHSKIQGVIELLSVLSSGISWKPSKIFTSSGSSKCSYQCLRLLHACFSGVHRVDAMVLDRLKLFVGDVSFNDIGGS